MHLVHWHDGVTSTDTCANVLFGMLFETTGLALIFPEAWCDLDTVCIVWMSRYYRCTGDRPLLTLLYPRAERAIQFLISKTTATGLSLHDTGCGSVVDWGYMPPPAVTAGGVDLTLNCFFLTALAAMSDWCVALGKDSKPYDTTHRALSAALSKRLGLPTPSAAMLPRTQLTAASGEMTLPGGGDEDSWVVVTRQEHAEAGPTQEEQEEQEEGGQQEHGQMEEGQTVPLGIAPTLQTPPMARPARTEEAPALLDWSTIGYHAAAMILAAGLLGPAPGLLGPAETSRLGSAKADCIAFIKQHLGNCFPNKRSAPRAANPKCRNPQLYTP
jgi:hypothetical protein|eukprot:COSAG01_NODE_5925_length_3948_cov_37.584631_2_plen_328_part_00